MPKKRRSRPSMSRAKVATVKSKISYAPGRSLPVCEGPKLGLFKDYREPIEWCEMLGSIGDNSDSDDSDSTTADGYVFRAVIKEKNYAIKIFKFYDPRSQAGYWKPLLGENASLVEVGWFSDPFYAECRAYGKMQATATAMRQSSRIAVPCHGYMLLRQRDARILRQRGIDIDITNRKYQEQTTEKCQVRAIVKDLASSQSGVDKSSMSRIIKGICYLNRQGIYNMDVRADNFRDGLLVDFGSSWTEPHALLDSMSRQERDDLRESDRLSFNVMCDDEIGDANNPYELHSMKRRSQPE